MWRIIGGKMNPDLLKKHADRYKERGSTITDSRPRRKFEYGGLLEMDQSGAAVKLLRWAVILWAGPERLELQIGANVLL